MKAHGHVNVTIEYDADFTYDESESPNLMFDKMIKAFCDEHLIDTDAETTTLDAYIEEIQEEDDNGEATNDSDTSVQSES